MSASVHDPVGGLVSMGQPETINSTEDRFGRSRPMGSWAPVIPFVLIIGVLLFGSAVWLIRRSFEGTDGGWSVQAWRDVLEPGLNRRAIITSTKLAAYVASIAAVFGSILGWFLTHLAEQRRGWAIAILNVATNFGGASLAMAMVATFGTVGFVQLVFKDLTGSGFPLDLYGFGGMALVYSYFLIPLFVLLMLPALAIIKLQWFEAAQICGATRWQFWRRVGGPTLLPFLGANWALIFAWAIGQYSVPFAIAGSSSRIDLMTLRIGALLGSVTGGTNRFQRAAALSVILLLLSALALLANRRLTRRASLRTKVVL
jgi:putative spermidine/putrescine transport system permease protein